jgi:hypothetical protein
MSGAGDNHVERDKTSADNQILYAFFLYVEIRPNNSNNNMTWLKKGGLLEVESVGGRGGEGDEG